VAARQMQGGFGGMLSIRAKGGEAAAIATAAHVALWKRATSLGGTESLIEHRASAEGAGTPAPSDLLRLSVGIEHVDDLIADLEQALAAARLKVFKRATSLGGVESLVEHRASVEGPGTPCPPDLLRLSVGIEHVDDLIADLEQALQHARR